jgi:hypothetical protein
MTDHPIACESSRGGDERRDHERLGTIGESIQRGEYRMRCYRSAPVQFIVNDGRLTLRRESWRRRMQLRFESLLGSRRRLEPNRQPLPVCDETATYDSVDTQDEKG